ncbi:MAG: hypothetical protein HY541_01575 [Deltaproteobacteria bacterium]|nr:hypothetical protein [Deltaproteobacteria bacterium]
MSELLVIASKVKKFIKEKGDCNTSASTMEALTQRLQQIVEKAIENAKSDGRKTVMDRDVPVA